MRLGKHFTLAEFLVSDTAKRRNIPNVPGDAEVANLRALVVNVLDPLRSLVGRPIIVSSGYRSPQLNAAVGGSNTSQHSLGQAADFSIPGMSAAEIVATMRTLNLPFDQVIDEFGSWVHVSYGPRQRRQVLRARKVNGRTVYLPAD